MEWKNQRKIINSPRRDFMNWSLREHLEVRSTPLLYSVKRAVQVWKCLALCYCCLYEFAGKGQMADRGCHWSARLSVEMVKNKWKPTCTFVSISHHLSTDNDHLLLLHIHLPNLMQLHSGQPKPRKSQAFLQDSEKSSCL